MDITIIGTGNMARGIATRALAGGHTVTLLGTTREKAQALAGELSGDVHAGTVGDPLSGAVVVLAVWYQALDDLLGRYGDQLTGKTVVDITNPVDPQTYAPLTVDAGSAAQEIALKAPGAKVVKAFNTTFAGSLVEGEVAGQPLDVFVAADDDEAKARVRELAESSGLRVLDAGPLAHARQLEGGGVPAHGDPARAWRHLRQRVEGRLLETRLDEQIAAPRGARARAAQPIEHALDSGLERGSRHTEAGGDLAVRREVDEQLENLPVVRAKRFAGCLQQLRNRRRQVGSAIGHHVNGGTQLASWSALVHDAVGAREHRWDDHCRVGVGGVQQDAWSRDLRLDAAAEQQAVRAWQLIVEDHDIGSRSIEQRPQLFTIRGGADAHEPGPGGDRGLEAHTNGGMIIDNRDPNRGTHCVQ
jgi:predicted dinucleotide-binding enzyme